MIYDLLLVGNGLAAQTFLFELLTQLKSDVTKSQNFLVAQVFNEDIAPACSLKTTATVSLSGIAEGITELGNELRDAFFLFENFFETKKPSGIEKVSQYITFSSVTEKEKLLRRYGTLEFLKPSFFREESEGVTLHSYIISPEIYLQWFEDQNTNDNLSKFSGFVRSLSKNADGLFECELLGQEKILARKVVLATGAYSKIMSHFFDLSDLDKTQVVAGNYLEKSIDLKRPSLYLTLDGHNLVYRSLDKKLIIGSASVKGQFALADIKSLESLFQSFCNKLNFSLGEFSDFKIKTGLRHKGQKRRPIYKNVNGENDLFVISGFYKNGFTFGHLSAKKVTEKIFTQ